MEDTSTHAVLFEKHRYELIGAAYRVLGTVQDSEDAVQETWLRWRTVKLDDVVNPRSYLLRSVTRTAINTLRSRQRRREDYPGPWLPEPVSTDSQADPGEAAEIADEVSLALLVVLESLSALERAAFVLREAFGLSYAEVAETLGRSEAAVRQLVRRARAHVQDQAPRNPVDASTHRALTEKLLAVSRGTLPMEEFVSDLAPDVMMVTDAGGKAKAALRPIFGVEKVLRFAAGVMAKPEVMALDWNLGEVNGRPALIGANGTIVDAVVWIEAEDGVITRIDMVRNPDKLQAIQIGRA